MVGSLQIVYWVGGLVPGIHFIDFLSKGSINPQRLDTSTAHGLW
jgi:hypothetical protein